MDELKFMGDLLVLHVDWSHVGNLRHVGVVESHIAEDRGPKDTGQHKNDDSEPDKDLSHVVQRTLLVFLIENSYRLYNIIPNYTEGVNNPNYCSPNHDADLPYDATAFMTYEIMILIKLWPPLSRSQCRRERN